VRLFASRSGLALPPWPWGGNLMWPLCFPHPSYAHKALPSQQSFPQCHCTGSSKLAPPPPLLLCLLPFSLARLDLNDTRRGYAVVSALAASARSLHWCWQRGHRIDQVPELPLVVGRTRRRASRRPGQL